jgi:hypothetical protein
MYGRCTCISQGLLGTVLYSVANNKKKKQLNHSMPLPFWQCCEYGLNKVIGSRSREATMNQKQEKLNFLFFVLFWITTNVPWGHGGCPELESPSWNHETVILNSAKVKQKTDSGEKKIRIRGTTDTRHCLQIRTWIVTPSVADPDPGSSAFLTPGSGMGKTSGSGSRMNNPHHIS